MLDDVGLRLVLVVVVAIMALTIMINKRFLSKQHPAKTVKVRRFAVSAVLIVNLFLAYPLSVVEFPYTLAYIFAPLLVWGVALFVLGVTVDYCESHTQATPTVAATQHPKGAIQGYSAQSPVDRIYAWETMQQRSQP